MNKQCKAFKTYLFNFEEVHVIFRCNVSAVRGNDFCWTYICKVNSRFPRDFKSENYKKANISFITLFVKTLNWIMQMFVLNL